jgi:hypothetical protein
MVGTRVETRARLCDGWRKWAAEPRLTGLDERYGSYTAPRHHYLSVPVLYWSGTCALRATDIRWTYRGSARGYLVEHLAVLRWDKLPHPHVE